MDLETGKREWEMEQMFIRETINLINDLGMGLLNGDLQDLTIEETLKKTQ